MGKHSKLSPSSSDRWLTCTASVEFSKGISSRSSSYANEGTDAHREAEQLLSTYKLENLPEEEVEKGKEGVVEYYKFLQAFKNLEYKIESRVTYYKDQGGTADFIAYDRKNGHLHVVDFKYGQFIKVDAVDNNQMRLYSSGALEIYPDARCITVHVVQPRMSNINGWTISREEIEVFRQHVIRKVTEIETGVVEFRASDKACMFCPSKHKCTHYREETKRKLISSFND